MSRDIHVYIYWCLFFFCLGNLLYHKVPSTLVRVNHTNDVHGSHFIVWYHSVKSLNVPLYSPKKIINSPSSRYAVFMKLHYTNNTKNMNTCTVTWFCVLIACFELHVLVLFTADAADRKSETALPNICQIRKQHIEWYMICTPNHF